LASIASRVKLKVDTITYDDAFLLLEKAIAKVVLHQNVVPKMCGTSQAAPINAVIEVDCLLQNLLSSGEGPLQAVNNYRCNGLVSKILISLVCLIPCFEIVKDLPSSRPFLPHYAV